MSMRMVRQVLELGVARCRRWGDVPTRKSAEFGERGQGAEDGDRWPGRVSVHAAEGGVGATHGGGGEKGRAKMRGLE
jgi:hypothetical protein